MVFHFHALRTNALSPSHLLQVFERVARPQVMGAMDGFNGE